jgi:S-DNA-T family DNA segregation ATPase FtsK/SpoIIIE
MNKKQYAFFISISCMVIGFAMLCLLSGYHYSDSSIIHRSLHPSITKHWMGSFGASLAGILLYLFGGIASWIIGLFLLGVGYVWLQEIYTDPLHTFKLRTRVASLWCVIFSFAALCSFARCELYHRVSPGGLFGHYIQKLLCALFRPGISVAIISTCFCAAIVLTVGLSPVKELLRGLHKSLVWTARNLYWASRILVRFITRSSGPLVYDSLSWLVEDTIDPDCMNVEQNISALKTPISGTGTVYATAKVVDNTEAEKTVDSTNDSAKENEYSLPPLDLFKKRVEKKSLSFKEKYEPLARIVEEKLATFGIDGKVTSITVGPVVVVYEYEPAIYVKVSRIVALEDDLALALQAHSLRIIAPVPGTAVVRLEVSKREEERDTVYFGSLFSTMNDQALYKEKLMKSALPLVIGKGVRGEPLCIDLASLPHILIAGSTGSGKSVVIHSCIMGLLYTKTPQELGLIYIDPKQLEGAMYKTLPHMIFPPIVIAANAIKALHWTVSWMENRYSELAAAGVRDVYEMAQKSGKPVQRLVVIIDELADLMLVAGDEVERSLARLAQMGRAAGIHLIVATQRPSVDVITGVIKANFPARIALRVATKMDSRVIIDTYGAQALLGKGDMLLLNSQGDCIRAHGVYVSQEEISSVVSWISLQQQAQYRSFDEFEQISTKNQVAIENEEDKQLYATITQYVAEQDEISISLLQRQFRIGFNRSARIVEQLERDGFIAASSGGAKTRKVLR